jgi:hypothetical protein
MDQKEYIKRIKPSMKGEAGYYFRTSYEKAIPENTTVLDVVLDIIKEIKLELKDCSEYVSDLEKELSERKIEDEDSALLFINDLLSDSKHSQPELCGYVCGILCRQGKLKEIITFLQLDAKKKVKWEQ